MPDMGLSVNPLAKYFREPKLYVTLPSKGYYYKEEIVSFTVTNEIPIFPLTAYDELLLKNPDALFNGDAVEKVVHSCAPQVTSPRRLCVQDMDVIILAIRAASYGDEMNVDAQCPSCKHEGSYAASIRYLLETALPHDQDYTVSTPDKQVVLHMMPQIYDVSTKAAVETFEQMKIIQQLTTMEATDAEKREIYDRAFERLCQNNIGILASQVSYIEIPEGVVTERAHIEDYLRNVDTKVAKSLQDKAAQIAQRGLPQTLDVECEKCQHEWATRLAYDPSYFFG